MNQLIEVWGMLPYGKEVMVLLATAVTILSFVCPVYEKFAKWTETKLDDRFLSWLKNNFILKKLYFLGKQLKRLSLV